LAINAAVALSTIENPSKSVVLLVIIGDNSCVDIVKI
jgi:hypothetical protein